MHKEYKGLGATIAVGVAGAGGAEAQTCSNPPVAEVLMHIEIEIDRMFNLLDGVCNRVSCVCSNNPMHIPAVDTQQVNGAKEHQQPSEVLLNLREKLSRIERASNILSELQRQLQI